MLKRGRDREIFKQVRAAVARWPEVARQVDIPRHTIAHISSGGGSRMEITGRPPRPWLALMPMRHHRPYGTGEEIYFTLDMLQAFAPLHREKIAAPLIIIGERDETIPAAWQKDFCIQQAWRWLSTD